MAAGAAAVVVIANAIKAAGAIVHLEPEEFARIASKIDKPLIVSYEGSGFFRAKFQYIVSYKGLAFYTKSPDPLPLPADAEIVKAGKIWVPDGF